MFAEVNMDKQSIVSAQLNAAEPSVKQKTPAVNHESVPKNQKDNTQQHPAIKPQDKKTQEKKTHE
jgi:hypothetical protein